MLRRVAIVVIAGLLTTTWSAAPAGAVWASTPAGTAQARSTAPSAPGPLTAACGLLLNATVKLDWSASSTPWVTQYEVRWGTNPAAPTNSQLVTALTFTTPALGIGTWHFTVRSAKGTWRSLPSNQPSRTVASVLGLGIVCL